MAMASQGDFLVDWAASAQRTQEMRNSRESHGAHAYDTQEPSQGDAPWSAGEILAVLDLLRVAEQVIFTLPPDVTVKYAYIRSMVAKNIEQERLNASITILYLFDLCVIDCFIIRKAEVKARREFEAN